MTKKKAVRKTIANDKGGCGKTSLAVNLSSCYAQNDRKVLLIDADPQHNASTYLGFEKEAKNPNGRNLYRAIRDEVPLEEVIVETKYENLFFVPGCEELTDFKNELKGSTREYEILDFLLNESSLDFDNVNIDTHPDFEIYTLASLKCSHYYIIPVVPDLFSSVGLKKQIEKTEKIKRYQNKNLKLLGIVVSRFKKQTRAHRDFLSDLREAANKSKSFSVLNSVIPESDAVQNSINTQTPINHYGPAKSGPAAAAFMSLAGELLPKLKIIGKGRPTMPIKVDQVPDDIEWSKYKNRDDMHVALEL